MERAGIKVFFEILRQQGEDPDKRIQGSFFIFNDIRYNVTFEDRLPADPKTWSTWLRIMSEKTCYVFHITSFENPSLLTSEDWTEIPPLQNLETFFQDFISSAIHQQNWEPLFPHFDEFSPTRERLFGPIYPSNYRDQLFINENAPNHFLRNLALLMFQSNLSQFGSLGRPVTIDERNATLSSRMTKPKENQTALEITLSYEEGEAHTLSLMKTPENSFRISYKSSEGFELEPKEMHTLYIRALKTLVKSSEQSTSSPSSEKTRRRMRRRMRRGMRRRRVVLEKKTSIPKAFPWKWVAMALIVGFGLYYRKSIMSFLTGKANPQQ